MGKTGCLLVFTVLLSASVSHANPEFRFRPDIVGGVEAAVGEFPFIASLQESDGFAFCGGSLIKPHWILTAAHCVTRKPPAQAVVGLYKLSDPAAGELFHPTKVFIHPKNSHFSFDYDFALVRLDHDATSVPVDINTAEVVIPPVDSQPVMTTVAGWGSMGHDDFPDVLRKVDIPLIPSDVCNKAYSPFGYDITDRMICAGPLEGGKDSCQGDSGGPLLLKTSDGKTLLVGTVSWGLGCAEANYPGVYGKVNAVADWIGKVTAEEPLPPPPEPKPTFREEE